MPRLTRLAAVADPLVSRSRLTGLSAMNPVLTQARLTTLSATSSRVVTVAIDGGAPTNTQVVYPGQEVTLTAAASFPVTTWAWSCSDPTVQLTGGATASYLAPGTLEGTTLTFTVTASGGGDSATDTVIHTVRAHAGAWQYVDSGTLVPLILAS